MFAHEQDFVAIPLPTVCAGARHHRCKEKRMLKKILIGFGLLIVTLVAAGGVFWMGWLTPPDADEVCENVDRVVEKETEEQLAKKKLPKELLNTALASAKKDTHDYCERFAKKKPLMMAQAVWVKRLKCMRDAPSMDGLKTCDEIKSF